MNVLIKGKLDMVRSSKDCYIKFPDNDCSGGCTTAYCVNCTKYCPTNYCPNVQPYNS